MKIKRPVDRETVTSGESSESKSENKNSRRTRTRSILFAILATGCVAVGINFLIDKPLLAPPIPEGLEKLEPQLRTYIAEKILWLQEEPRAATRHATLGLVYAVNSLWPEARAAFENAAVLNPKEPLAQLYAAIATQELGERESALDRYRRIVIQFPQFPQGYYRLGDLLLKSGANDEAEAAFEKLVALAPNEWRGYTGLGEIELRRNQHAKAAEYFERALNMSPEARIAHHLLGLAYRGLGRMEDAERELSLGRNAVAYPMPDSWAMNATEHMKLLQDQFDVANEHTKAGDPQMAIKILELAKRYHPDHTSLLNNLAVAYLRAGHPEKTRELGNRVAQLDPNNLSAFVNLAGSCLALQMTNEALHHAERAIEISPKTPHGYLAKANVLLTAERDTDALDALKAALQLDPQNAQLQLEIGDVCLYNLSRKEEALDYYSEAARLIPAWPALQARIAETHLRLENVNEARDSIDALEKLIPADPAISIFRDRLEKLNPR